MKLLQAEVEWLRRWGLVDGDVMLPAVKLRVGGPVGVYLRATNHSALTVGDTIWFRTQERRRDIALLVHELVHVGQYRKLGRFRFLMKYAFWHLRRMHYSPEHPFEAPAYERQAQARDVVRRQGGPVKPAN